ncbi:hypothetical protein [Burkholderia sp. BCC0322]|uniref:hypothetical protein n=1 Tax=unclassified Burkholderia TaxID=2613784 RepID=UPI00158BDFE5|nr:hypothetical protein [Burkholderia sp. BCC0322]
MFGISFGTVIEIVSIRGALELTRFGQELTLDQQSEIGDNRPFKGRWYEALAMEEWKSRLGVLARSELLRAAAASVIADYGDDVSPTVLHGGLGRTLARDFSSLSSADKTQVCDAIEEAMNSDDTNRVALVATGLLEALFTASRALSHWEQVVPFLGMQSRSYLSAWAKWGDDAASNGRFAGSD